MNDAEARLAERLAPDLERVLGSGILVEDLDIEGDGPVTIRVACLVDGTTHEIEASGETALEAMSGIVSMAAEARLAWAFTQVVKPR